MNSVTTAGKIFHDGGGGGYIISQSNVYTRVEKQYFKA